MLVTIVSWILTFITLVAIGSLITKFKNKKWIISMIIILLIIIINSVYSSIKFCLLFHYIFNKYIILIVFLEFYFIFLKFPLL